MEAIACLVPKLHSEMRSGCGTQLSRERNVFTNLVMYRLPHEKKITGLPHI